MIVVPGNADTIAFARRSPDAAVARDEAAIVAWLAARRASVAHARVDLLGRAARRARGPARRPRLHDAFQRLRRRSPSSRRVRACSRTGSTSTTATRCSSAGVTAGTDLMLHLVARALQPGGRARRRASSRRLSAAQRRRSAALAVARRTQPHPSGRASRAGCDRGRSLARVDARGARAHRKHERAASVAPVQRARRHGTCPTTSTACASRSRASCSDRRGSTWSASPNAAASPRRASCGARGAARMRRRRTRHARRTADIYRNRNRDDNRETRAVRFRDRVLERRRPRRAARSGSTSMATTSPTRRSPTTSCAICAC